MPGRHTAAPAGGARRRARAPQERRSRRPGRRPGRGGGWKRGSAILLAAVIALFSVAGWSALSSGAVGCGADETLTLAAAPEIAPVVEDVVADLDVNDLDAQGVCGVRVAPTRADDALAALGAGVQATDLWIPDTSAWLSQLPPTLADRPARSVATSPVVLVGPADTPRPETWLGALSAPGATLLDPRDSGASVGALAALQGEAVSGRTDGADVSNWVVTEAQSATDYGLDDAALLAAAAGGDQATPRWFPTTEQRFTSAPDAVAERGLGITVPESGTTMLDYPLVSVATGADARAAAVVAKALADRLRSPDTAPQRTAAGFRPPSGTPTQVAGVTGRVERLEVPSPDATADLVSTWTSLNVDARMLAVLDVSGSMLDVEGSRTRAELARDAMLAALRTAPDTWDLGLWAFSLGLGHKDADYRVLAPIRTLAATVGGRTQREDLADAVRKLPDLAGGGTALYDTTLAAYRAVADGYLSDRFNSVVLLTDGRNEDWDGLRLQQLLDALARERDKARPLPVITIGMGPEADTSALHRISEVTGGQSYVVRDPRELEQVFNDALLQRVGWRMR
jgi:hypothetical protein